MAPDGAEEGNRRSPFVPISRPRFLHRTVPVSAHLAGYGPDTFFRDALAGLTVAAMAIPSAMGFAAVAGLPPVNGLYALLLPVVAYALLGSSRQMVVGPSGATATLVAAGVAPLADGTPANYLALCGVLALLVAGTYLLARTVRLGWIADYLSVAALVGFVHGIAITLICGQLGKLTGVAIDADRPLGQLGDLLRDLDEVSGATLATGLAALVLLLLLKRFAPRFPGPLLVVVGSIVLGYAVDLSDHGIATIGSLPSGLPSFDLPTVPLADAVALVPAALGIVFVTFSDGILIARSVAGRHQQHVDANQELLAMGVANISAGLTQGFPIGNSNSRTTVNEQMGVKTQVGGIVLATTVALVLLVFADPVEKLPAAVLGAVIVAAAIGLISLEDWRHVRTISQADFVIALAAMGGVVLFGVLEGIVVAVGLSILDVVRRSARPHDAVLGFVPKMDRWANASLHPSAQLTEGVLAYRLDDRLFFANADYVQGRIREALAGSPTPVRWFVFDAEAVNEIDSTGVEALENVVTDLERQGITFAFARLKRVPRERLERAGFVSRIGEDHLYPTVHAAVAAAGESA
jgi:sulfate permease, SulP family